ncbi:Diphthamide biosynthesis protein 4 [Elasticomyces elasticus]|nr:Diphthamide biosynthesis protein 4 [Elasticomyces elasticus]
MPDCYSLLGLEPNMPYNSRSQNEVKKAYHRTLLKHHPDRAVSKASRPSASSVTIDEITQAYKTLSDLDLRAEYDRLSSQAPADDPAHGQPRQTGLEIVDLDALVLNEQTQDWSRSCRCGDQMGFIVTEAELEKHVEDGELTVGCKGCSLWLRVLFGVEESGG